MLPPSLCHADGDAQDQLVPADPQRFRHDVADPRGQGLRLLQAGVDDQDMVRALGIRIQVAFAVVFAVGAFLAGLGGVMGASFAGAAVGATDGAWLLNSLVVVIIGGLGSVKGAAAGALLFGLAQSFAPAYLPTQYSFYSVIATFVLLAAVLVVRPNGLYGKAS